VQLAAHFEQPHWFAEPDSGDPGDPNKNRTLSLHGFTDRGLRGLFKSEELPAVSASGYCGYVSETLKSLRITSLVVFTNPYSQEAPLKTRHFLALLFFFSCCLAPAATAQNQQPSIESGRKILRKMTPTYPELARKLNLAGTVRVIAIVATDGEVKSVEPKGGSPILLRAAEDAVSKWKFASGGESRETIEVHFAP